VAGRELIKESIIRNIKGLSAEVFKRYGELGSLVPEGRAKQINCLPNLNLNKTAWMWDVKFVH
jgi:hypothetical protein